MIEAIVVLILIVSAVIYLKKNPLKKGNDIFSIYDNSFTYRLIVFIIFVVVAYAIYIFQKK